MERLAGREAEEADGKREKSPDLPRETAAAEATVCDIYLGEELLL